MANRITRWVAIVLWALDGLTTALFVFCESGAISVVLDGDHIPFALSQVLPDVYGDFAGISSRFLHRPVYYVAGGICIALAAFSTGWVMAVIRDIGLQRADVHTGGDSIGE